MEIKELDPKIRAALGVGESSEEKTFSDSKASIYRASIQPEHPGLGPEFNARRHIYAELVPGTLSLLGMSKRNEPPDDQLSILIPAVLKSGKYSFNNSDPELPSAYALHFPNAYSARTGFINFTRDDINKTITANFEFTIETDGEKFDLKGKLYLEATGQR